MMIAIMVSTTAFILFLCRDLLLWLRLVMLLLLHLNLLVRITVMIICSTVVFRRLNTR